MNQEFVERLYKTWTLMTHPIRPTETELLEMRKRMDVFTKPRTLVLGVTPELIDMVIAAGAERPVVFEVRSEAIEALRRMATRDWSRVEFLIDDWRNFRPELAGNFDVVLGHATFVFLAYPDQWNSTLGFFHRYLTGRGRLICRHMALPPGGHPMKPNYERILARFEAESAGKSSEEQLRYFREATTEMRLSATLAIITEGGVVDRKALSGAMAWISQDLEARYNRQPFWDVMGPELRAPMPTGYEELWPLAAPPWDRAVALIEQAGFAVDAEFIGDRPQHGAHCVFTAERR